jgi:hypothetical protein
MIYSVIGGERGIRTLRASVSNSLMARDFWRQRSWGQSVAGSLPFAAVTSSPLECTRVVETFWRRIPGGHDGRPRWRTSSVTGRLARRPRDAELLHAEAERIGFEAEFLRRLAGPLIRQAHSSSTASMCARSTSARVPSSAGTAGRRQRSRRSPVRRPSIGSWRVRARSAVRAGCRASRIAARPPSPLAGPA